MSETKKREYLDPAKAPGEDMIPKSKVIELLKLIKERDELKEEIAENEERIYIIDGQIEKMGFNDEDVKDGGAGGGKVSDEDILRFIGDGEKTANDVEDQFKIKYQTANNRLGKLVKGGNLTAKTKDGEGKKKFYMKPAVG